MKSCNPASDLSRFYITRLLVVFFLFNTLASFGRKHTNSNRAAVNADQYFKTQTSPLTTENMRINLYLLNSNNTTTLADGVLIEYNNMFHDRVTLEDAYKFTNINENLGLIRYGSVLAIERRPVITAKDTLFLKLWKTTIRNYQFEFVTARLDHPGMQAVLKDAFLGTATTLSLAGTTKINFSITSDAASADLNRFQIIYEEIFTGTLPVSFASVNGYRVNNKVTIDWKVENEINTANYEIQRSADGSDFSKVNTIAVSGKSRYSWTDNEPVAGNNYYRIKGVDRDGAAKFSTIVKVTAAVQGAGPAAAITIYPNPAKGNSINLRFVNQPIGEYLVKLLNNNGQLVYSGKLTVNGSNISQPLSVTKNVMEGIYQVEIKAPDNTVYVKQALIRK